MAKKGFGRCSWGSAKSKSGALVLFKSLHELPTPTRLLSEGLSAVSGGVCLKHLMALPKWDWQMPTKGLVNSRLFQSGQSDFPFELESGSKATNLTSYFSRPSHVHGHYNLLLTYFLLCTSVSIGCRLCRSLSYSPSPPAIPRAIRTATLQDSQDVVAAHVLHLSPKHGGDQERVVSPMSKAPY